MIGNIAGMGSAQPTLSARATPLTEDQSTKLTELLAKYDAKAVSEADAKAIAAQVKDLGISPGKALAEAMGASGFDARAIGDAAGVKGDRPPPPPPGEGGGPGGKGKVDDVAVSMLQDLIDSYGDTEITEEDWSSIFNTLQENGVDLSKPMVDIRL